MLKRSVILCIQGTDLWKFSKQINEQLLVYCVWNVMAHAQKPNFVFRRNGRVRLNWHGRQFSRLLAAEMSASAVVMMDTPCSEVVWRVLATHSNRQFPLHFPSRASPCAIAFQLDSIFTGGFPHLLFSRKIQITKYFFLRAGAATRQSQCKTFSTAPSPVFANCPLCSIHALTVATADWARPV